MCISAHVFPFQRAASGPDLSWPTATQSVADGQETALNTLSRPGGLGVSSIVQVFPFQRSASSRLWRERLIHTPTAVHATGDEQEMPFRYESPRPGGSGTRWMAHVFPFHSSARAWAWKLVSLPPVSPAARHTAATGQETDVSCPGPGRWTRGDRCITHVVPFQRSITGGTASPAPTAVQAAAAEHPTAFSKPPPAPGATGGLGVGWRAHRVPFQCSASVSSKPTEVMWRPAAVQDVAAVQKTPLKLVSVGEGFGVDCTVHLRPSHLSARPSVRPRPR
jgi:hypothetical protein